MHKEHKIVSLLIGLIVFILVKCFLPVNLRESTVIGMITFLSITFGFYMTTISVLYGSTYTKELFEIVDSKKKTQRQIHTLASYFKIAAYWALASIFILLSFSMGFQIEEGIFLINDWAKSILISIISINAVFLVLLFKVFIKGFIVEVSEK